MRSLGLFYLINLFISFNFLLVNFLVVSIMDWIRNKKGMVLKLDDLVIGASIRNHLWSLPVGDIIETRETCRIITKGTVDIAS